CMTDRVTLALPSKGALADPTTDFLRDCGLRVHKPNPRQYTGSLPAISEFDVLFQRVRDVVYKVSDGTAHLGVAGYDLVREHPHEDVLVIHDHLGYGHCQLLVAVPEAWVDVQTIADLVEVALDFREFKHRNLRVATTYTNLARQFLHQQGIHHFTLVKAEGAIEAAPTLGYADIIVDLTQTGTTLRENHLKPIPDGVIIDSQACLIGNRRVLRSNPNLLDPIRKFVEFIDAALQGRQYYQLTTNIRGTNAEQLANHIVRNPVTRGLQGPTLAPIYAANGMSADQWHTLTLIVESSNLLTAIEHLRSIGGTQTSVVPIRYAFLEESPTYSHLLHLLNI
ncbi:MAG: ATP phosphoribosyltransferase, partial [Anaerolineae bacterium]|nr:ATP phosphoribosyltransferase [Anaerolineae bacterium]